MLPETMIFAHIVACSKQLDVHSHVSTPPIRPSWLTRRMNNNDDHSSQNKFNLAIVIVEFLHLQLFAKGERTKISSF